MNSNPCSICPVLCSSSRPSLRWNSWTSIFDKRLLSFALCYSQSLLLSDFKQKTIRYSGFKNTHIKIRDTKKLEFENLWKTLTWRGCWTRSPAWRPHPLHTSLWSSSWPVLPTLAEKIGHWGRKKIITGKIVIAQKVSFVKRLGRGCTFFRCIGQTFWLYPAVKALTGAWQHSVPCSCCQVAVATAT